MVAHRVPITLLKIRYQGLDPDVVRTLQMPNTYWEEIPLKARQIGPRQTRNETEVEGM